MSRGAGRVMREVRSILTVEPTPIVVLARRVYGVQEPSRAQVESVRRASKRLVQLGHAHVRRRTVWWATGEVWPSGEPRFEWLRSTLNVRTAKTEEGLEQERAAREAAAERWKRLGR